MQGTIVMLMALSGLGCHHTGCGPAVAPCYDGCYGNTVPMCYTTYVAPSCYSACYSLCYSGSYTGCFGGGRRGCFGGGRRGLFGGLCHKRSYCCDYPVPACYDGLYGCYGSGFGGGLAYGSPVYGSYAPVLGSGPMMGGPIMGGPIMGPTLPPTTVTPATPSPTTPPTEVAPPGAPSPPAEPPTPPPAEPPTPPAPRPATPPAA